jgi:hypothetical protein
MLCLISFENTLMHFISESFMNTHSANFFFSGGIKFSDLSAEEGEYFLRMI